MFSKLTIAQPKLNVIILYFLIGMMFIVPNFFEIFYWPLSFDDSLYMGAIRMVLDGNQAYRDFLWDPPIFLYINAFMAYLFGLDLIQLRILSFLFGLSAFLLLGFIMYRLRGHAGSILALGIAVTTFENVFYVSGIYMVSVATFFLLLGITFELYLKRGPLQIFLAVGAFVVSFSVRTPNLIIIPVYGIYLLLTRRVFLFRNLIAFVGGIIGFGFLTMGYFVLSFPQDLIMGYSALQEVYNARGMSLDFPKQIFGFLSFISYYPIIYTGLLSMFIFYLVSKKQKKGISKFRPLRLADNEEGFLVMILLMLLSMIFFDICFYAYPDQGHLLFYFPLTVILISWYYSSLLTMGLRNIEFRNLTITLIILAIFVSFLAGPDNPFKAIKILKEEKKYSAFTKIKSISAKINAITRPGDKLLTFVPVISIYSKRELLPGLEASYCNYYPNWNLAKTQRHHVYNLEQVKIWLTSKAGSIIMITDKDKVVSHFNERNLSGKKFWKFFNYYLNQNYKILFTEKIDSYYWGNCFVYVPK